MAFPFKLVNLNENESVPSETPYVRKDISPEPTVTNKHNMLIHKVCILMHVAGVIPIFILRQFRPDDTNVPLLSMEPDAETAQSLQGIHTNGVS